MTVMVGQLMGGLVRPMKEELFQGGYIQADETPVGVQDSDKKGSNHQGYLFEFGKPFGPVIFIYRKGRGRDGPQKFLNQYKGLLQTDGWNAYDKLKNTSIIHLGCMAHLRRPFEKALRLYPKDEDLLKILGLIRSLYQIESKARKEAMSLEQRHQLRLDQGRPLMTELYDKILAMRQLVLPKSAKGKACNYAMGQWKRVEAIYDHPAAELDNNMCENGIRPVALGRKNWLHLGSHQAAEHIANIISILETCRRLEINPRNYLLDVLPGLANRPVSDLPSLTPSAWKKARGQA